MLVTARPRRNAGVVAFLGIVPYNNFMPSNRVERVNELVERLIAQDEMYESFLNNSPWGLLVVDKTFHIVYINKTLERMCGYSLDELRGEHLHKLLPKEDRRAHTHYEKAYVKNPHGREGNHGLKPRILHSDGHLVPVEISLAPMKVGGQTFFAASIRHLKSLFNTVEGEEREA